MKRIIVTGGCGYIGSHTIVDLIENGYEAISIDNLSKSKSDILINVEKITGVKVKNFAVDLTNESEVLNVFSEVGEVHGIIHFAAFKSVGESVKEPLLYFQNNIESQINILKAAVQFKVKSFVFSSSCTVYGNPEELPVTEESPWQEAESPYGRTKQIGEKIVEDISRYSSLKSVLLRYFNPVGAHETGLIGQLPMENPENLIPIVTQQASGLREKITVFGDDYDTRDGSCVRDYIHVSDIAHAHTLALEFLESNAPENNVEVFNLGIGEGVSVLEILKSFEQVNNLKLNYEVGPRRSGDVVAIYANNAKAKNILNWKTKYGLEDMMRTAWKWENYITNEGKHLL